MPGPQTLRVTVCADAVCISLGDQVRLCGSCQGTLGDHRCSLRGGGRGREMADVICAPKFS